SELLQRCESLEKKTATFENIVCVLNREVERVAMTAEACSRQHRLDQDKIEALSSKVQQLERSIGLE
nr:Chain A, TNF receptor-associated factor 2 [Homo sapiens]3M0A_B Chain B, TNF receptor-associated factor 2 [Homo sapiens]3M0A_C Chain C, TNF receptor-associated factor 2 [Homo sapiens]3M0D_A Chain A, TNF receptor-associated factor 2 [Homo sapiens]3M0D_B Chain B, TNF receptor-associated factor 2 [Homo sapiens]